MSNAPKDFTAVSTIGDLQGLMIITKLRKEGWEIDRVDTSGGRFIYLMSRVAPPQGPPKLLAAPMPVAIPPEHVQVINRPKRKPKKS